MSCASNIIDVQTPSNSPGQTLTIPGPGGVGDFVLVDNFDNDTTYEIELIIVNNGVADADFASQTYRLLARAGVILDNGPITNIANGASVIGAITPGVSGGDYIVSVTNGGIVGDFSVFTRIIEVA